MRGRLPSALANHRHLKEGDLQELAPESPAKSEANFHFPLDIFTFGTSCSESRFLLLNMGLSRRTTAPSVHPLDLGCSGFGLSREFVCLAEVWLCGLCGVCFSGKVSGADLASEN